MPGMPTALITGITGQDGLYLAELLLAKGYDVHGLIRGQNNPKLDLVRSLLPDVVLHTGDLTDMSSLIRALRDSDPDEVYNLGAISFVAYSWENAAADDRRDRQGRARRCSRRCGCTPATSPAGCGSTRRRARRCSARCRRRPQRESTLLWPRSPYGVAKVFGHYMTINYRESYGMHASSGILFNHESPRRGPEFVTRKISQAVARIKLGLQDDLTLGNLDSRRDWGFAGDYVDAMWRMLQQDEADDYVIATGETHSIRDFLDIAFAHVGIDDWASLREAGPALHAPGRGRPPHRRREQGPRAARLEADRVVRRAGRDDGRRRHRGAAGRLVTR